MNVDDDNCPIGIFDSRLGELTVDGRKHWNFGLPFVESRQAPLLAGGTLNRRPPNSRRGGFESVRSKDTVDQKRKYSIFIF